MFFLADGKTSQVLNTNQKQGTMKYSMYPFFLFYFENKKWKLKNKSLFDLNIMLI